MLSSIPIECPAYLLEKAEQLPSIPTAIVNAGARLPLQSTRLATEKGLIIPTLVGNPEQIKTVAQEINWDISDLRIVAAEGEVEAAQTSVALARNGEVASLMKGNLHTDHLLRAVINKETGLRTGSRLSHVFHMTLPGSDKAMCITDAAINVAPNVDIKLDIARNAVSLLHSLGNKNPNIAVLSATEVPTEAVPSSMDAATITKEAANGAVPGATVDGPFAFDNAVSPEAAKIKGINSPVAGNADVLLVPNIETGNALFKQMVYFMSAAAAGVVMGAKVPIVLTSRADPAAARLAATALASIYASTL
ncbi:MAG: bifunctional enoyl-CoA hydratase/phosphate acetyltransferase [Arenicella sp.]